jgi:hypothetical protein
LAFFYHERAKTRKQTGKSSGSQECSPKEQVHVFGLAAVRQERVTAEKWTCPCRTPNAAGRRVYYGRKMDQERGSSYIEIQVNMLRNSPLAAIVFVEMFYAATTVLATENAAAVLPLRSTFWLPAKFNKPS